MKIVSSLLRVGLNGRFCLVTIKVDAPISPSLIYAVVADYRHYFPHTVPQCSVHSILVSKGGKGDGTTLKLETGGLLPSKSFVFEVDEPHPGSMIVLKSKAADVKALYKIEECANENSLLELSLAVRLNRNQGFIQFVSVRAMLMFIGIKHILTLLSFLRRKQHQTVRFVV
jgi:hypothetical protein